MVPISSKRLQRTNNNESQAIISTKSKMMTEVVSSNSHNAQDVNKTTISTSHTNQTPTTVQYCSICNKNNARYKCPRCNLSYCSVSCYQIHDGTSATTAADYSSSNNRKICTESLHKRHVLTSNITANDVNRVQSVLSNVNNEININLDKLEQRNEHISKLINKNEQGGGGEIVNGMIEEIKDNVCKSNRAMDVFRIDQLNSNSDGISDDLAELTAHQSTSRGDERGGDEKKKDELSIGLLISGMNAMDSNDNNDDSDMLSSSILNLGLGSSSNQRPLVIEDEIVSTILTIRSKLKPT